MVNRTGFFEPHQTPLAAGQAPEELNSTHNDEDENSRQQYRAKVHAHT